MLVVGEGAKGQRPLTLSPTLPPPIPHIFFEAPARHAKIFMRVGKGVRGKGWDP
jgi:hypothetical protein